MVSLCTPIFRATSFVEKVCITHIHVVQYEEAVKRNRKQVIDMRTRFLSADPGKRWWEEDEAPEPAAVDEGELWQKAADRVFLPKRVKRLEAENEGLKRQVEALKKRSNTDRRCKLWKQVALVKKANPKKRYEHRVLGNKIDNYNADNKIKLRDTVPKSWIKAVPDFPRLLIDVLEHPKLKKRARVLIAQAK
jgi:hypothetical protein